MCRSLATTSPLGQPLALDLDAAVDRRRCDVALDVVLTRRNTFGPLHQVPLRTGHYGPDNFTTSGERWIGCLQPVPVRDCSKRRPS